MHFLNILKKKISDIIRVFILEIFCGKSDLLPGKSQRNFKTRAHTLIGQ